jgi:hypothetical protein
VFDIDIEQCPDCAGRLKIIATARALDPHRGSSLEGFPLNMRRLHVRSQPRIDGISEEIDDQVDEYKQGRE